MPPPELLDRPAPASVGALVLEQIRAEAPMPRHDGPRAEEAHLRAQLAEVRAAGDAARERELSVTLARLLAARGRDLGSATKLARRALMIGEDAALRTELGGWLAGLGESALAAATLRGLGDPAHPAETARTLVKIAVLLARADDTAGAADALREAMEIDPRDAMASELYGTLGAWAPAAVSPAAAAAAYLDAAARREAASDKDAAFEDRLRAFDLAPGDPAAAQAVAAALTGRGRHGAADEVLRSHATALLGAEATAEELHQAIEIHRRRMLGGLADNDAGRAVGAVLDAGFEGEIEGEDATRVDEVLGLSGLYELLALRLEMRATTASTAGARAAAYQELGRLYAGPLASPDRAIEAWIEAQVADPGGGAARAALRDHAAAHHDPAPLIEALIRIGEQETGEEGHADRAAALRELATLADERADDPALASWALDRLEAIGDSAELVKAEKLRLLSRVRRQEEGLAAARRAVEGADGAEARGKALRKLLPFYQGRVAELAEHVAVLVELARGAPTERPLLVQLERACHRSGDFSPLETVLRERAQGHLPRVELVRARLALSAIARRRGDDEAALDEVLPLLTEAPGHRGAACATLLLSTRTGRSRERADALVQLAGPVWPALRATLLAVAAELYLAAGVAEAGRRTAEQACEADPSCARAVTTLATAAGDAADRVGAAALERAMSAVLPRSAFCARLAKAFDALGEHGLALAWTQRWLALRPGSAEAMERLLRRASAGGDPARLGEALGWVLAQPTPLGELTEPLCDALDVLAEIDRNKARSFARRALDVLGPRVPILRARLLRFAERAGDPGLAIAVLERYVAAEGLGPYASELLLELAERRVNAGDFDGAARELSRAAESGAEPGTVLERADALERALREATGALGSDGRIAHAEARATAFAALVRAEPPASSRNEPETPAERAHHTLRSTAASAFRELGSLKWDLADDRRGAEEAFFRAGELAPRGGVERFARDLLAFAGAEAAIELLATRANRVKGDDAHKLRATLLIEAANLANEHGLPEHALVAASSAIESDPSRADAVALVEKNAHVEGGLPILDRTYDLLAAAAMGRYGRRAAHYRGARQLERRGAVDLALRHAAACFEAVPGEGTSYVLLTRLAERAADPGEAVRAMERVAEADAHDRTAWLKRAAALCAPTEEGARTRLDLLLRALNARPEPGTVEKVGAAIRELTGFTGDRDAPAMRFERAVKASLKKLDGPDGSRAAVAMARLAVQLGAIDLAFAALTRAMSADGDIDEFGELVDLVPDLAVDAASAWVDAVRAAADKPYSSVGAALLKLASKVAAARGDLKAAALLLVAAVKRAPDDEVLIDEAELAAADLADEAVTKALDAAIPPEQRVLSLVSLADLLEREGHEDRAIAALERAIAAGKLPPDAHARASKRLGELLHQGGRISDAEGLLRMELTKGDLTPSARSRAARDLAASLARRGDAAAALEVLVTEANKGAGDDALLIDLRGLARAAPPERRAEALSNVIGAAHSDDARLAVLRELAPLAEEIGDEAAARAHFTAIGRLDPEDAGALEVQEREANERGDHATIAAILAQRIASAPAGDRRRMLRLRRAAVLEQRLRNLADAAEELTALLDETPDDVSALRFLADIKERLGELKDAGLILRRLADLAATSDEKADYGLRASNAYIQGGDLETAEHILETVAPIAERESVLEVRVELARRRGDTRTLSEELDRLAACSRAPVEQRAAILLEGSRAAAAIGEESTALDRARRAVKLAPSSPDAVLEARRIEYRAGGSGTPREAQAVVDELNRVGSRLEASHVELHAFLLAEALDVIQGGGAGMRELSRRHAEVGPLPLVALGMAERLVRGKSFEAALPLFEQALAGDLRGLRSRGRVALAAAEAAASGLDHEAAARLLGIAASEPETRVVAQRRQTELTAARESAARLNESTAAATSPSPGASPPPTEAALAEAEAKRPVVRAVIVPPRHRISQPMPAPRPVTPSTSAHQATTPSPRAPEPRPAPPAPSPGPPSVASPISRYAPEPHESPEEGALLRELAAGSFDAGERLIELYGGRSGERLHDVLSVRKQQAGLRLGDPGALRKLLEAAIQDGHVVYARAVEHVLALVDPETPPVAPPPLATQRQAPDLVSALLFRSVADSPVHEALAIVLDTGLYRRDVAQYQLTGVARVQPGAATILGEVLGAVARVLGQSRTALFHVRAATPPAAKIALLSPPAIILSGDLREETPELRYLLGASLTAANPEHALVNALNEEALRTLVEALQAAFGPVASLPKGNAAVARLGQNLWQLVPPRADRRLREICAGNISYDAAVTGTRQAMRRAGLFASGSLATALALTAFELGMPPETGDSPDWLTRRCEEHPAIADLVRLAIRTEFAEARWLPAAPQERRRSEVGPRSRAGT